MQRLLLAGLSHQAQRDRAAGRAHDAANLVTEMGRRFPNDTTVRLLAIESLIHDTKDPAAAVAALDSVVPPSTSRGLCLNAAILRADALAAMGQRDSARALLSGLMATYPTSARLRAKLDSLR